MYDFDGDMYKTLENQSNMILDLQNAMKKDAEILEAKKNKKPPNPLDSLDNSKFSNR